MLATEFLPYWHSVQDLMQCGLIKTRTSVHFLARLAFLRILLHISPQFKREMSTELC